MFMKITQKTHQKKYVFSIHFSMAPEGLAALAASDEDLDSRTPVARLVPAAEGGYKEGTGIRGGGMGTSPKISHVRFKKK
jgi:hypothetical protein